MKRGSSPVDIIMMLALLVVVLLVGVVIFIKLKDVVGSSQKNIDCASQIRTNAYIVQKTNDLFTPSIVCPTDRITVSTSDEEQVKAAIAGQMKSCWDKWGDGQFQLFGTQEGIYCHICSTITVNGVSKVQGLPKYLDENYATKNQTYTQYLQGRKSGTFFSDQQYQQTAQTFLPTDKPVGVIFYYAKGYQWYQVLWNKIAGQPAVGASAGFLAGGATVYGANAAIVAVGAAVGIGISAPFSVTIMFASAVTGSALGAVGSMEGRADASYMSLVVVRPVTTDDIKTLGCQFVPVKNG